MKELIIVTGATGGMGYEAAKHFHKDFDLLLLDIDINKLEVVSKELGNQAYLKFDITKEENINALVDYLKTNGKFKHLLHFAGVSESMGNSELIYKINLVGTKNLLDAIYDYIKPGGVILNTSSITAYQTPMPIEALPFLLEPLKDDFITNILKYTKTTGDAYGFSKRGVLELTKNEVVKWGLKGVRIVSISPGAIKTPMVAKEMETHKEAIDQLISLTPVKRIGLPEDIVNLVEFLISDKASFITGTDILIDGGVVEAFKVYAKQS